jgi:hypothetical protein
MGNIAQPTLCKRAVDLASGRKRGQRRNEVDHTERGEDGTVSRIGHSAHRHDVSKGLDYSLG